MSEYDHLVESARDSFTVNTPGSVESGPDGYDADASAIGLPVGRWPLTILINEWTFTRETIMTDPRNGDVTIVTYIREPASSPIRVYLRVYMTNPTYPVQFGVDLAGEPVTTELNVYAAFKAVGVAAGEVQPIWADSGVWLVFVTREVWRDLESFGYLTYGDPAGWHVTAEMP